MLQAGITLDKRYDVLETLGEGGMGRVYRVRHARLNRDYALKELTIAGGGAEAQFLAEARILAELQHPALPRVSDFFVSRGASYLVMDLVPGDDLQAMLDARSAPFSPAEVLPWLSQLLDALAYLHARSVVHRDIKPANLKLAPGGKLMLVDFGIAKQAIAGAPGRTGFAAHEAYTPYLSAPEQVMGQGTTPRSDLYAAGATFAYMLTQALPPIPTAISGPLGAALARAMAPDPAGRFADAASFKAALGACAGTPSGITPGLTTRRDIRRG